MQFVNLIDDQGRLIRVDAYNNGLTGQIDSHTYSYLGTRKIIQSLGVVMGLDKLISETYIESKPED